MLRFFLSRPIKETDSKTNEPGEKSASLSAFNDRVLLGGIVGTLGLLTRDVWSFLAKQVGLAKFYIWQITASVFMDKKEASSFLGNGVGILGDVVLLASWLLLFAILFGAFPTSAGSTPKDALSSISAFIGHSIFGISMGIYAQILLKKYDLFEEG